MKHIEMGWEAVSRSLTKDGRLGLGQGGGGGKLLGLHTRTSPEKGKRLVGNEQQGSEWKKRWTELEEK